MTSLPPSSVPHTDSATVAAYLDGQLRGRSRAVFVAHLAECASCRREVVELRLALGEPQTAIATRRYPLGVIAAIAAVLLLSIVVPKMRTVQTIDDADDERVRSGMTEAVDVGARVEVIGPADGATVSVGTTDFSWQSAGRNAMYVVTVQDSVGTDVWSNTGIDTSVVLPDTVRLNAGARYFWSVQAQRADGYSMKSVLKSFQAK